jgi:hypothetical protein
MKARVVKTVLFLFIAAGLFHCSMEMQVIGGSLDTPTNDGITPIDYPFAFNISSLGSGFADSDIHVVANGLIKASDSTVESPLLIRWSVSGTTLTLYVFDSGGTEFQSTAPVPAQWLNKRIELTYLVSRAF